MVTEKKNEMKDMGLFPFHIYYFTFYRVQNLEKEENCLDTRFVGDQFFSSKLGSLLLLGSFEF